MTNYTKPPQSKPYSQQVKESVSKKKAERKKIVEESLLKKGLKPIKSIAK